MTLYGTRVNSMRQQAQGGQPVDNTLYKTRRASSPARRGVYDGNFPALVFCTADQASKGYPDGREYWIGESPRQSPRQSPFGEFA
jgi:hypothetical protein